MKHFLRNEQGSMGTTFAVCVTVLLIGIGAAVDLSAMVSERTKLQTYSDMGVLAAIVSGETELSALQTAAEKAIYAQTNKDLDVLMEYTDADEDTLRLTISSDYQPFIMGAFKAESTGVTVLSEGPMGGALKLNLAMVLDTTESMDGTRMSALKTASTQLLNTIDIAAADGDARVSVVPFSDYVRIDPALRGAAWLRPQPDHIATWNSLDRDASTNCRQEKLGETESTVCDTEVFITRTENQTWIGCMGSRRDGYHVVPEYGVRQMQGPAGHTRCSESFNILHPLNTDLTAVNAIIQDLDPIGKTYIPAGLIWGWRTLDRNLPFDEAKASDATDTRDVLLLMTDGTNTISLTEYEPYQSEKGYEGLYHWGEGSEEENARIANQLTTELCTSIKASGIDIVTVAFEVTDVETISMLRRCASSPSKFFNAQSNNALIQAFERIGSGFTDVRLSR